MLTTRLFGTARDNGGKEALSPMKTIRQEMMDLLSEGEHNARSISQHLKLSEKEVCDHLSHISHSLVSKGKRLVISPARCLECNYVFIDRSKFTKPARCPRCRGEHIEDPKYRVE
jgi:transcriptional regulator